MALPLMINQEGFESARVAYEEHAAEMLRIKDTLVEAIEGIRDGWKSDAGTAFFEKFDDQWLKNFNDYIAVIEHMSTNMNQAKEKYQAIFDEAEAIKLE